VEKVESAKTSGSAARVYIFAYDVAYDISHEPVKTLLGQPVEQFKVDQGKRAPKQMVCRPQMARLPPTEKLGPHGPVQIQWMVKLRPVGAISITARVPFEVHTIQELVRYHDLKLAEGSLSDEAGKLADQVRKELAPFLVRPVAHLEDEEAYAVSRLE
jgi:hypothetical protein